MNFIKDFVPQKSWLNIWGDHCLLPTPHYQPSTLPASDLRVSDLCDMSHKEERDLLCKIEHLWEARLQLLDTELGAVLAEEGDDAV